MTTEYTSIFTTLIDSSSLLGEQTLVRFPRESFKRSISPLELEETNSVVIVLELVSASVTAKVTL